MPEIPSVQNLGARDVAAPRRNITAVETPSVQQQQYLASTPRAVGDLGQREAQTIFTRQDSVSRAKAIREYSTFANDLLNQYETERDLSDDATLKEFGTKLKEREQQLLGGYRGSLDSRADLSIRLGDITANYSGEIAGKSIKAQQDIADTYMTETQSTLSSSVYDDASQYDTAAASWDNEVRQMSGVYPGNAETAMSTGGKADLAVTAITGMLDRGDYDAAEQFLLREDISRLVSSAQQRQIRSRVTTQRIAQDRERNALRSQVTAIEEIMGPLSHAQKAKLLGIDLPPKPLTLAEMISSAEAIKGSSLSEAEMTAAYRKYLNIDDQFTDSGTLGGGEMFGTGLEGRALEILTQGAEGWAAGLLSPQEERQWQAALVEYTQPKTFTNPDSGLVETRRPDIPPFVRRALEMRPVGDIGQPSPQPVDFEAPNPLSTGSGEGFYNNAENLTGVIPTVSRALSQIPIVGDLLPDQAAKFDQIKNEYDLFTQQITTALRENPRFAETERQYIQGALRMDTALIDRPDRFRNALQGVDNNLAVREQLYRSQVNNSNISRVERQKAMDILSIIVPIRQKLGVPRLVQSVDDLSILMREGIVNPGEIIRTPQGDEYEVPASLTIQQPTGGNSGR